MACNYALQHRLIDYLVVRKWADEMIAEVDSPAPWVLDLADCHANDVDERLRRVPGEPSLHVWPRIISGLISVRWRENRLTLGTLRSLGWSLYTRFDKPQPFRWGVELDHSGDYFEAGIITESQFESTAEAIVRSFQPCEAYVPTWMWLPPI